MKTISLLVAALLALGAVSAAVAQTPAVENNTWTSGAPMPTPVWGPAGAGVIEGEIYVVGGVSSAGTPIADTQIYNPATNTWRTGVPLPTTLQGGSGAVVKSILYILGGNENSEVCNTESITSAVWAYDPKTNAWSSQSPLPIATCDAGIAVENDIIYVIGGVDANDNRLATVQSYNPADDTWADEAPLLNGKSEPSVGRVGTTIVAADGFTASGWSTDNEGYDASTNAWTSLTPDTKARNWACAGGIGAKLYAAGGQRQGDVALSLTESFTVAKNTWNKLAPMPHPAMASAAAVHRGRLYCFGGTSTYKGMPLDNVQIHTPRFHHNHRIF